MSGVVGSAGACTVGLCEWCANPGARSSKRDSACSNRMGADCRQRIVVVTLVWPQKGRDIVEPGTRVEQRRSELLAQVPKGSISLSLYRSARCAGEQGKGTGSMGRSGRLVRPTRASSRQPEARVQTTILTAGVPRLGEETTADHRRAVLPTPAWRRPPVCRVLTPRHCQRRIAHSRYVTCKPGLVANVRTA
jgi:hypothetical protein